MRTRFHEMAMAAGERSPGHGTAATGPSPARWRIGGCVLDTARRELLREGRAVRVEAKVFDLLAHLAGARGAMLSHAELRSHLWPDTQVSAASLRRLVKEARRALGGDGRSSLIVTVHGRGYRLVPSDDDDEISGPPGRRPRLR